MKIFGSLVLVSSIALACNSVDASQGKPQLHQKIASSSARRSPTTAINRRGTPTKSTASATAEHVPRGGGPIANTLPNALAGAATFALIEQLVKMSFQAAHFQYPAALGACIFLFAFLCVTDAVAPSTARQIFESLAPGAAILAKWFPVFFIPGLVLLPLSPPIGGAIDVLKIVLTVAVGFVYSLTTTLGGIFVVRNLQGKSPSKEGASITKKPGSQYTEDQWKFCWKASIALALASATATKFQLESLVTPLQTVFTFILTVTSFIFATRLPSGFNKVVHPLVTSSVLLLGFIRALAAVNGQEFLTVLRTYKVGSLNPTKAGAGDFLLYILGPCVVSFAISVYSRKEALFQNLPMVLTAMVISSLGGLFSTGAFVRLLEVGGTSGNAALVRLSVLARNVTTALALALTQMIGGDVAIVSAAVCLTGIIGASYGMPLLNAMGVKDPICRGLGIGSSSIGLGVAAMASEPDAFPFAMVGMVLSAVFATTMTSIPSVRNALIKTTIGSLPAPA